MNEAFRTFADALEGLLNENQALTRELIQHFSDISPQHLNALIDIWGAVPTARKQFFLTTLKKYLEQNILFSFDLLARRMLQDEDAIVRATAIRLLSDDEKEDVIPVFLEIATADAETATRAEAITALGKYVLKGELDEISDPRHDTVVKTLIDLYRHSTNVNLRQRAVEALGFSSRKEVVTFIREAWQRIAHVESQRPLRDGTLLRPPMDGGGAGSPDPRKRNCSIGSSEGSRGACPAARASRFAWAA